MTIFYKVINPVVKAILRSRFHKLLSHNTLVLEYVGNRSGRHFSLPISYFKQGQMVYGFTSKENRWWRSLRGKATVQLTLQGRTVSALANVQDHEVHVIAQRFTEFLTAVPRDAKPSGVRLNENRTPNAEDILSAAGRLACVQFTLLGSAS